jgi:hypothetical protein
VLYYLYVCVCVGVSDTTTGYAQHSALGGSPGPTGFGAAPRNFFMGGFLLFLADL